MRKWALLLTLFMACSNDQVKPPPGPPIKPTTTTTSTTPTANALSTAVTSTSMPSTVPPAPLTFPNEGNWGDAPLTDILCPRLRHPAHHFPCPSPQSQMEAAPAAPVTDVQACIARYESDNGLTSPNIFQFKQGTWESFGGTGSPETATRAEQDRVFHATWRNGAGKSHWLAQQGRCF